MFLTDEEIIELYELACKIKAGREAKKFANHPKSIETFKNIAKTILERNGSDMIDTKTQLINLMMDYNFK